MHPTDPKPLDACFEQGLQARLDGESLHDNPYAAGSEERREWNAGFRATAEGEEGEDAGALGPSLAAPHRGRNR